MTSESGVEHQLDLIQKVEIVSTTAAFPLPVEAVNTPETISISGSNNSLTTDPTASLIGSKGDLEANINGSLAAETFAPLEDIVPIRATAIAGKASDLVGGDRDRQHGAKHDNFSRIAATWNAWLSIRKDPAAPLTAHDVGVMMAMMKLARTQSGSLNIDDYIDACGYAACAGEVAQIGE